MLVPPVVAALLLLLFDGDGFPNYDTEYALVWGRALADGAAPDTSAFLSPTPHPLANAVGALLALLDPVSGAAPHGTWSESLVVGLAFLWLGVLAFLVVRLGEAWGGLAVGILAAVIVLTREPLLSFGVRAYVDIPYVCLVLGALLRETRRPRDGVGVLVLLALAGLLRPEAWLFAALYLVWLWWPRRWQTPRLPLLVALAAAGPVLWVLHDLLITGDPLYSLTGTRENADVLDRATGFDDVPVTGARRLGEIAREPVLLGAPVGGVLLLARRRGEHAVRVGLAALAASLLAFTLLAGAGLPIITRYLLLPAVLLALLTAVALVGWARLAPGDPARGPAAAGAAAVAAALLVFAPGQLDRIDRLQAAIAEQTRILSELRELQEPEVAPICRPLAVPNQRPIPQLALWRDVPPSEIVVTQREGLPPAGTSFRPASRAVARRFILDRRDLDRSIPVPPESWRRVGSTTRWIAESRCAGPSR